MGATAPVLAWSRQVAARPGPAPSVPSSGSLCAANHRIPVKTSLRGGCRLLLEPLAVGGTFVWTGFIEEAE